MRQRRATWERWSVGPEDAVFPGAESGSDAASGLMNKGGAPRRASHWFARRMRTYGIVPEFLFVLAEAWSIRSRMSRRPSSSSGASSASTRRPS
jgi:hypothetical protein